MCDRFRKDFHRLMRTCSNGNEQITIIEWNDEELDVFKVKIRPANGPYRGGEFEFIIREENYPNCPPLVHCCNDIYHPNIDPTSEFEEGNVCINLLEEWNPRFNLDTLMQGLLFIFYEPNLDDPLSPYFAGVSYETFNEDVRRSIKGLEVDGNIFDNVLRDGWLDFEKEPSDTNTTNLNDLCVVVLNENDDDNDDIDDKSNTVKNTEDDTTTAAMNRQNSKFEKDEVIQNPEHIKHQVVNKLDIYHQYIGAIVPQIFHKAFYTHFATSIITTLVQITLTVLR
ncbi:unnamed protein product [Owenia fusiformis]|uniref:Uncharacterized protein n=1 Tax=Owenia fusiformis TaxID=6347 RepID=A0A8J1TIU3_OWEFU|nr:unnamed protein product [Owenia fusiformis]